MLHRETLKEWEDRFKMEMKDRLHLLTPETVLEAIKSKRDAFIHADQLPFDPSHPFVLRHGDFHGRDVLVRYNRHTLIFLLWLTVTCLPLSRTSPRTIVAVVDRDFGGSQALPFADDNFEVISDPDDETEAQEQEDWQKRIHELIGRFPFDYESVQARHAADLATLEWEEKVRSQTNQEGFRIFNNFTCNLRLHIVCKLSTPRLVEISNGMEVID
jgi:hypothetical protein